MFDDYRKSLKHPEAEELFDLGFYRPMAWLFVRAVHRTPITPNQVTGLSLAASLTAAYCFGLGDLSMLAAGTAWYTVSNILDCADGQLARIQGSGTPSGRIIDGLADYIGTVAIFLGIGIGFSGLGMNLWVETVAAGASSAFHAMIFDQRQTAFIAANRKAGGPSGLVAAPESAAARATSAPSINPANPTAPAPPGAISRLYAGYTRLQETLIARILPDPPARDRTEGNSARDAAMIRLWSYLGPTTNRTALIAFALIGRIDLFLWAVLVPGNLWLAAVWYLQRRVDRGPDERPDERHAGRPDDTSD